MLHLYRNKTSKSKRVKYNQMKNLILIKLGGSLITDKSKPFTAKPEIIDRLAKEIKKAQKIIKADLIIAHGSGSFGHTVAAKYQTKEGNIDQDSLRGVSLVADAAIQINRYVISGFLENELNVLSFSPLSLFTADNKQQKTFNSNPLQIALNNNLTPILYGDIIMDETQGFCIFSSETTLTEIALSFRARYESIEIIYAGDTDGVYDDNKKTINKLTPTSFEDLKKYITGSENTDVTGGMLHKVSQSMELAKEGINTTIINGNREEEFYNLLVNHTHHGTLIVKD